MGFSNRKSNERVWEKKMKKVIRKESETIETVDLDMDNLAHRKVSEEFDKFFENTQNFFSNEKEKEIRKHEREKTIKEVIGKVSKVIENSCTCDYDELGNLNDRCLLHMEFRGLIKELKED